MKFSFNRRFYRYSHFYQFLFWSLFLLPISSAFSDKKYLWFDILIIPILLTHAYRAFFYKDEKELSKYGFIFHIGLILLVSYLLLLR